MPDLKDLNSIYLIVAFVVPGLIATFVRAQFINGRIDKMTDAVLGYLVITLIYYGLSIPVISWILTFEQGLLKTALWWGLTIVGPACFGLLLGVAAQHGWLRWMAKKLGLRVVHGTPSSWDWQFANCYAARFVMVTLTDGSSIAGIFGTASFASTDPTERDIYIQEVLDVDANGIWNYRSELSGVLILAKEIRAVEFMKEL